MAVDDALLQDAAENGTAALRFYGWNEPTLSLGYFQQFADRELHTASRACAIVRRQTGGGAILHDRELTYSLTLPPTHPFAKQTEKLYQAVHEQFIDSLSSINCPTASTWKFRIRSQGDDTSPGNESFLCFQRRASGDVILIPADNPPVEISSAVASPCQTWKILGSAQRRYRGAILQHGSLLLARSPAAPELPGIADVTGLTVAADELANAAKSRLANALCLELHDATLPPDLQSKAAELANSKYGSLAWTNRR